MRFIIRFSLNEDASGTKLGEILTDAGLHNLPQKTATYEGTGLSDTGVAQT
jgi:hypothetical protein